MDEQASAHIHVALHRISITHIHPAMTAVVAVVHNEVKFLSECAVLFLFCDECLNVGNELVVRSIYASPLRKLVEVFGQPFCPVDHHTNTYQVYNPITCHSNESFEKSCASRDVRSQYRLDTPCSSDLEPSWPFMWTHLQGERVEQTSGYDWTEVS